MNTTKIKEECCNLIYLMGVWEEDRLDRGEIDDLIMEIDRVKEALNQLLEWNEK